MLQCLRYTKLITILIISGQVAHNVVRGYVTKSLFSFGSRFSCVDLISAQFRHDSSRNVTRESRKKMSMVSEKQGIPSLEQVASDPFTKQLQHASYIVEKLKNFKQKGGNPEESNGNEAGTGDPESVLQLLKAMFTHSDGIRGFFVQYLTQPFEENADEETGLFFDESDEPKELLEAMTFADPKVLVPLMCMNVMMPTAMSTLHEDPNLQRNSQRTANRAAHLLKAWLPRSHDLENECLAATKACLIFLKETDYGTIIPEKQEEEKNRIEYWMRFYKGYQYGPGQVRDIQKILVHLISTK